MSIYNEAQAEQIYQEILKAMTGNAVYSHDSAKKELDRLLEYQHCASCDMHSCEGEEP